MNILQAEDQNTLRLGEGIKLHSWQTYIYKYLLPLSFIPWDGFQSMLAAFPQRSPDRGPLLALFFVAWIILTPLIFWYAYRLKKVVLSREWLLVEGYFKETAIPLSDVEILKETSWPVKSVILKLKRPTEFGDQIRFMPKPNFGRNIQGTLTELRARIRQAQSKGVLEYGSGLESTR